MKRIPSLEIYQPSTVAETSAALADNDAATLYAGGTELLLAMKELLLRYEVLIDLKTVSGLRGVTDGPGRIRIGSTSTHMDIESSPLVRTRSPMLARTASHVANPRVRAAGTLGGNLCFAEPHSDLATLLLCLDAECVVAGEDNERRITVDQLIVGPYETSLEPSEVLVAVELPHDPAGRVGGYEKFQVHERPMLGVAVVLDLSPAGDEVLDARVAVGSASPFPRRSMAVETLLRGPVGDRLGVVAEAARVLASEAELRDDDAGSAEYKGHLIEVLLRRQVTAALASNHLLSRGQT